MKTQNLQYIAADMQHVANKMEIKNILDFCQLIEKHHVKEVFVLEKENDFAIVYQQFLLTITQNGYENLDDYRLATTNNFAKAKDFYEAQSLNIHTFENFELMRTCGIQDATVFKTIDDKNYIEGFKQLLNYQTENEITTHAFKNPYELYTFASENHFDTFDQFFQSYKNGFTNFPEQNIALEKGFTLAKEYKEAIENGFGNYTDYIEAKKKGIATLDEYAKKSSLEIDDENCIHDQKILLLMLSKIDQGKKVSLNKIKALFEKEKEEYRFANKQLPDWFKVTLTENETFTEFLLKNENAIKIGDYDVDGEFFEIKPLNDRSVVIDGSNVAYNSNTSNDNKPYFQNLITLVSFLKKKGFSEITIIADASLRHKVADKEKLIELEKNATYIVAPAETTADVFLLSMVKMKHCLIISNDTFKDYKVVDPWIATNIDYFRLTFMITKDGVFMPDLDK